MIKRLTIILVVVLLFLGLHSPQQVVLQPFSGFPPEKVLELVTRVQRVYPYVKVAQEIPMPKETYYAARHRYKAAKLIEYLRTLSGQSVITLGLTTKDISVAKGEILDWGVMGLAYCPGAAGVVSTFRIGKDADQLYSVVIHELGHTQGLPHCTSKQCVMSDACGKHLESTEFCSTCKFFLVIRGWQFK